MIGIVDGDSFVYRCGFSVEKTHYLIETEDGYWHPASKRDMDENIDEEDVVWSRLEVGTLEEAKTAIDVALSGALKNADVPRPDAIVYLTPTSGTFRDTLGTVRKYKGNRDGHRRPVYYSELRDYLTRRWDARAAGGIEADDACSILARHHQQAGRDVVVIGQDKDLYQIPGHHLNWVTGDKIFLTERDARAWFWAQVLAGDPGDNILGCFGTGPTKATKLVQAQSDYSDGHMWPLVVQEYEKSRKLSSCPYKDLSAWDVALEMARLVRLNTLAYERPWEPNILNKEGSIDKEVQREISPASLPV